MSYWPKISVITPSYNQGVYIERTIRSVLDQKYPNLEFLVMDGGSTDNTIKVLRKYHPKITFISEKDKGQAAAINKGLQRATGDIVTYLNSDDTYQPESLKKVARFFKKNPRAQIVFGKGRLINKKDKEIDFYNDSPTNSQELFKHCNISQPTVFWRRKLIDKVGYFDESLCYTMDYDYWIRIAKITKFYYLEKEVLANTRIHPQAKTSAFTKKLHRDAIHVVKKHYGKVHHEWIFTAVDFPIHKLKNGSFWQEIYYWSRLFIISFLLQLNWNREFPSSEMRHQYYLWLNEIKQRFTQRLFEYEKSFS